MIDLQGLIMLCGFTELRDFQRAHRQWIEQALENGLAIRDDRWSEAIAVGTLTFVEKVKGELGSRARHREVEYFEGTRVLREESEVYGFKSAGENESSGMKASKMRGHRLSDQATSYKSQPTPAHLVSGNTSALPVLIAVRPRPNIMRVLAIVLALPLAYAGCSARQPARQLGPPFVRMQTMFDYSEHEPYAKPGENGISGQAFLTRQGDSVVTCAGSRVLLLPATSYFREMFWHMIIARSEPEPPENPYPSLKGMIRRTECDAQGNFSFSEIPDGTWFVLTQVKARDGGVLITELTLSNGATPQVLLTDKHLVGR